MDGTSYTRLKITYALCEEDQLCVCDVANIIGSTSATASHLLRLLCNMGLAKYRKDGKLVFYSLEDEHVKLSEPPKLRYMEKRAYRNWRKPAPSRA